MDSQTSLFDALTRDFCPPLDSSLVAALLVDIQVDDHRSSPSREQIGNLRATLHELATQADESQLSEFSDLQLTSPTDETSSTPDFYHGQTDTSSSLTSDSSSPPRHSLSSPLSFLQAALPHVSKERLTQALANTDLDADDLDLWDVISNVLSDEAVRELEERGIEGLDEDDVHSTLIADDTTWETVQSRKQRRNIISGGKTLGKKVNRGRKITLVDVRQQHHARPLPPPESSNAYSKATTSLDPWTTIMSVSEQLSSLIRSQPASYFQSYFHSPQFSTPYDALCSALGALCKGGREADSEDSAVFFTLLDILLPEYEDTLDPEQLSRLCSDVQLAVRTTQDHADDALDIVRILRELDSDLVSGYFEMGVYHLPPRQASTSPTTPQHPAHPLKNTVTLPSGPPPILPPPNKGKGKSPSPSNGRHKASPFQWQTVSQKRTPVHGSPPTRHHIPTYARDVNGFKTKGNGSGLSRDGMSDKDELAKYNKRIKENLQRRDELLREATKMYRKRNGNTRGGEVALYLAERAREFQKLADKEALDAARAKVQAKRRASHEKDTLDLHGITAAQATAIVKEELQQHYYSPARPLKIITGRGSHSVNQVSVLKPAIKKTLEEDGWSFAVWESGLVVRGKRATT
ncbi:hypothetical protein AX17_006953 [Amanita inopinata Kibby_2008]|nr:hypothetical protein AX17_006953 [Amanita inopinata Kibby_2008]